MPIKLFIVSSYLFFAFATQASDLYLKDDALNLQRNYGVNVKYTYSPYNFPKKWLKPPISGKGTQLSNEEISRMLSISEVFLSSYSKECLNNNLKNIILLKELNFYGKSFGGTNSRESIYIRNGGEHKGFSDIYILGIMHAEFSSILLRKNIFPKEKWKSINPKNFKYVGSGVAVLGQKDLHKNNEQLLKNGFLTKYAQSSLENDFNQFAIWIFTKPNMLEAFSDKYPNIRKKRELVLEFYNSICLNNKAEL